MLRDLATPFSERHLGPDEAGTAKLCATLGVSDLSDLIATTVPAVIRSADSGRPLRLPAALRQSDALAELRTIAGRNQVLTSMIGAGWYGTQIPPIVKRVILENPAWYTAYTPYQPEISQGRLQMLLNFQTMVADLTGMDVAGASLLDEATAAAEAMTLARRSSKVVANRFVVDVDCHPHVIDVLRTRAEPIGIEVVVCEPTVASVAGCFGVLVSEPGSSGRIVDHADVFAAVQAGGGLACVATDLLACVLMEPPGARGADVVVGSAQRFGVPMGFGGPHAGFLAVRSAMVRSLPGRLVGVSKDANGRPALRLALQTREQHIRREKATSNICTAQVLLAVMAAAYAMYHRPEGVEIVARRVHRCTQILAAGLRSAGVQITSGDSFFDTLTISGNAAALHGAARGRGINLRHIDDRHVGISCDEVTSVAHIAALFEVFGVASTPDEIDAALGDTIDIPAALRRTTPILNHPVFSSCKSETDLLREFRRMSDADLALDRTMIPLGSCTMKLNAAAEMEPITWPEFANMHPLVPADQASGYHEMIGQLESWLVEITGYDRVSLAPNSGAQGEYAGLLAIRGYHRSRGEAHRNVCLIPNSAHGTNAASAAMCGMQVAVVKCAENGDVDVDDLIANIAAHGDALSALMITYPSTHGVYEERVTEICDLIHAAGGQVYVDGANFNALVGVARPGEFGADVSHLNLHKTFCIPHGGGGPGVGPVCVKEHLAPFLPGSATVPALTSAPYGSAGILPIPWMYIRMMGPDGLTKATQHAIAAANYVVKRLEADYPVLYTGPNGRVAHECILDLRSITAETGVTVDDVAKRLMDYGFHAPTMSFPVAGTLMVEPTESESIDELDRFCDAMLAIRAEIDRVARGDLSLGDSPLRNAPHTAEVVAGNTWTHSYSREEAAFPVASLRRNKYWPPVGRIDGAFGDRNIQCSCPPMTDYLD